MANARAKSEQADQAAGKSEQDSDLARLKAKEYAPEFHQPGTDILKKKLQEHNVDSNSDDYDDINGKPLQNHNPHPSKSLQMRKLNEEGDNQGSNIFSSWLPMNEVSPDGSPVRNIHSDISHLNVNSQASNPMNNIPNHSPHNRSPSFKIRRYSFLAGSRRGRGFSEIFNSTILNDHFDQYSAQKDENWKGDMGEHFLSNHITDPSPDSGVSSECNDNDNRPLVRRRTMPSIVKEDNSSATSGSGVVETAHSSENIANKNPETFIIENGIRKRVKGVDKKVNPPQPSLSKGNLPNEFKIVSQNSLTRSGKHGSLPDIATIKQSDKLKPMSREEVFRLSTARRKELQRLQDLAERRRQGDVTVILGDLKDFVQQRQLLVLVIAVNLSLAGMFFNLLS